VTRVEKSRALASWMQAVLMSDEDLLAEVLRRGIETLMEAERDAYVNAAPFERGEERQAQRNGYKARTLTTRVGRLALQVPKTRDGDFYPSILQRYQRSEAALITALAECYVQGVSTRKVGAICQELFGDTLSHETVSRYVRELDAELEPWRVRPLEGAFPYVMLDARYEKARVDHRIVDVAVLVAIGVSETGHRQVLGIEVVHGETRTSWGEFMAGLIARGLTGVQLIVSDAHAGLQDARRRHFPGVQWQRCQRHFLMNALDKAPKALHDDLHKRLRKIWDESYGLEAAVEALRGLVVDLEPKHPELAAWLEAEGEQTLSCFHFPPTHWLKIRTTNGNERINQELLRRSRVIRIFPNPRSCCRIVTAMLKEWDEDWITGRTYLNMEHLAAPARQQALPVGACT
jgi:putative transposase